MKFYYGVNPAEKRVELLKSKVAKPYVDEIIQSADKAITEDSFAFKMSEYMLFFQNGNRSVFQKHYFGRRRNCCNIMFAYWLTEDEKYLVPLIDYIGYICDEFSWCLPAHVNFPEVGSKESVESVDLFQSETARLFAEIKMCVGEKLPAYILERMNYEVHRRIFASFLREPEKTFNWEQSRTNWATVCAAGCTLAALYFGTEEEQKYFVNRFSVCLDNYLEGISSDGCCLEGLSYWNYGGEHFVMQAHALKEYTNGETDYFKLPKVHELALFPQRVRLSQTKTAAFSDATEMAYYRIGLVAYFKHIYPDVLLPDLANCTRQGNVDSVFSLLWMGDNYKADTLTCNSFYFADAQWYVNRKEKFSFAAKGGRNCEPHNHNDIGSFMITVGDEVFLPDLGCGEYVRETFLKETRYTFVQNSSRGHSVPIVNGAYQCVGEKHFSKNTTATDSSFSLCMENAYEEGAVQEIKRHFEIDDNGVTLTDTLVPSEKTKSFTERFISKIEPTLCDGYVDFGIGKIKYDVNRYTPSVQTETFVAHNAVDIVTVYQLDFNPVSKDETEFRFEFVI